MAKVREEMEALEVEMDEVSRTQARQRGEEPPPSSRRRRHAHGDDDSDEDEFFDRVSAQKKARKRDENKARGQSRLPELRQRKTELENQQEELRKELVLMSTSAGANSSAAASESAASSAPTLDPLDAFMIDNRAAAHAHRRATVEAKLETLAAELAEIETTLGFAQPAYLSLRTEAVEATKQATQQPKAISAAAAALGADLVASARQHMDKQNEPGDAVQNHQIKREISVPRQPAPGSMAAAIAQARATEHSQPPQIRAGSSVASAPSSGAGSQRQLQNPSSHSGPIGRNIEMATEPVSRAAGAANSSKSAAVAVPERVSTKDLIAQIAAAKGGDQGEHSSAHTGSGGLGSEPSKVLKSKDPGAGPPAAKRGRMIDGKRAGLQVMSKKQKTNAPQFGRGVSLDQTIGRRNYSAAQPLLIADSLTLSLRFCACRAASCATTRTL